MNHFPYNPVHEEIFTSALTGKSYKYSELQRCWLRHLTAYKEPPVVQPVEFKYTDKNAFNINADSLQDSELFVEWSRDRSLEEFNVTNLAFIGSYNKGFTSNKFKYSSNNEFNINAGSNILTLQ